MSLTVTNDQRRSLFQLETNRRYQQPSSDFYLRSTVDNTFRLPNPIQSLVFELLSRQFNPVNTDSTTISQANALGHQGARGVEGTQGEQIISDAQDLLNRADQLNGRKLSEERNRIVGQNKDSAISGHEQTKLNELLAQINKKIKTKELGTQGNSSDTPQQQSSNPVPQNSSNTPQQKSSNPDPRIQRNEAKLRQAQQELKDAKANREQIPASDKDAISAADIDIKAKECLLALAVKAGRQTPNPDMPHNAALDKLQTALKITPTGDDYQGSIIALHDQIMILDEQVKGGKKSVENAHSEKLALYSTYSDYFLKAKNDFSAPRNQAHVFGPSRQDIIELEDIGDFKQIESGIEEEPDENKKTDLKSEKQEMESKREQWFEQQIRNYRLQEAAFVVFIGTKTNDPTYAVRTQDELKSVLRNGYMFPRDYMQIQPRDLQTPITIEGFTIRDELQNSRFADKFNILTAIGDFTQIAHRDGIQLIPINDWTRFAGAIQGGFAVRNNTITSNGEMQAIFSSDGGYRNLDIENNRIDTQSMYAIRISGMLTGKISNNTDLQGNLLDPSKIELTPLRLGGGNGAAHFIHSFKSGTYDYGEIEGQEVTDHRRMIDTNPNRIYWENVDLDRFRTLYMERVEALRDENERRKAPQSLSSQDVAALISAAGGRMIDKETIDPSLLIRY